MRNEVSGQTPVEPAAGETLFGSTERSADVVPIVATTATTIPRAARAERKGTTRLCLESVRLSIDRARGEAEAEAREANTPFLLRNRQDAQCSAQNLFGTSFDPRLISVAFLGSTIRTISRIGVAANSCEGLASLILTKAQRTKRTKGLCLCLGKVRIDYVSIGTAVGVPETESGRDAPIDHELSTMGGTVMRRT
jgi:hypothetical protein